MLSNAAAVHTVRMTEGARHPDKPLESITHTPLLQYKREFESHQAHWMPYRSSNGPEDRVCFLQLSSTISDVIRLPVNESAL